MARVEPTLFRSTIPFYERYRVPYPEPLIAAVAELCGIERGSRVLDLGCGPGQLAIAFARRGAVATAMDPDRAMLALARERAAEAGVALTLVEGSSFDLGPTIGRFRLVTMGRSFHWMDRDATLAALDQMIEPGGAIALFTDEELEVPNPDWPGLVKRLRAEFVPERDARRQWRKAGREGQATVLARSAFPQLDSREVTLRRTLTADEIVGVVYSYSDTSPDALGDWRAAFEAALRDGLARLSPEGMFEERLVVGAVIARRAS
jgi:ubiquinone/menaquinone biosynthesis C-methylase UbiE